MSSAHIPVWWCFFYYIKNIREAQEGGYIYINLCLIHVVWQKQMQHCKSTNLKLEIKKNINPLKIYFIDRKL